MSKTLFYSDIQGDKGHIRCCHIGSFGKAAAGHEVADKGQDMAAACAELLREGSPVSPAEIFKGLQPHLVNDIEHLVAFRAEREIISPGISVPGNPGSHPLSGDSL